MKKAIKVFTALTLSAGILGAANFTKAAPKPLQVHFINIGQGDATYIKTPGGADIIIDAGNKAKGNIVVDFLKKKKVDDIEVMIATHPDADHIGGLDEVLKAFKVESVYAPKVSHTTQAYKDFLIAVKNEKLTIKTAKADVALPLKDVQAKFVGPVKDYAKSDLNNWSAVLRVQYNKNSFLFAADAELASENDMIKAKKVLKADVLKVGHHGAKESTSVNFLNAVKPKYSIISVGKNGYGHPTTQTVSRLKGVKSAIYRTDQKGTITAISDGTKISIATERK